MNLAQIDTRKGEIKNLGKNKSSALEELKNIQEELNSLKESDDSDSNIVEAKKLEGSWLVFITETKFTF